MIERTTDLAPETIRLTSYLPDEGYRAFREVERNLTGLSRLLREAQQQIDELVELVADQQEAIAALQRRLEPEDRSTGDLVRPFWSPPLIPEYDDLTTPELRHQYLCDDNEENCDLGCQHHGPQWPAHQRTTEEAVVA